MKIELHEGEDGQWYVSLVARNGEIVLSSEGYASWSNALRAARKLQRLILPRYARIVER